MHRPAQASTILTFDASGLLLVTDELGWDDQASDDLHLIRPGDPEVIDWVGGRKLYPPKRTFVPAAHWWEQNSSYRSYDVAFGAGLLTVAAATYRSGAVLVWDATSGKPQALLAVERKAVLELAVSDKASPLLAIDDEGALHVWSTGSWREVFTLPLGDARGLTIHPEDTTAYAIASDVEPCAGTAGRIIRIDLVSHRACATSMGPDARLLDLSPDGRSAATMSDDGTLRIWNLHTQAVTSKIELNVGATATDIAFSHDGQRLAVATSTGQTRIIDVTTGLQAVPPLVDTTGSASTAIAWSPDGEVLAVQATLAGRPDHTDLWRTNARTWATEMCTLAGRDLTPDEWDRHVRQQIELPYHPLCP
jgi:WD40 repeat protein